MANRFSSSGDGGPAERTAGQRPTPASLTRAAVLLRALGDLERLRLAAALLVGERCVAGLAAATGATGSTVEGRLRRLRAMGLVRRYRFGPHVFYRLTDAHMADLVANALALAKKLD